MLSAFLCLAFPDREPGWLPQLLGLVERDRSDTSLPQVPPEASLKTGQAGTRCRGYFIRYRGFSQITNEELDLPPFSDKKYQGKENCPHPLPNASLTSWEPEMIFQKFSSRLPNFISWVSIYCKLKTGSYQRGFFPPHPSTLHVHNKAVIHGLSTG